MIVVAGGGPAGAATAALLAGAGRPVRLIERTVGPTDKICGEFLSFEAVRILGGLGVDAEALGGHRIEAVRLARGGRVAEAALPFPAIGLSRRALDEALLDRAAAAGAEVQRGRTVSRADGARLVMADGETIAAETLFLATGKHDLRGARRDASAEDLVGFKMHFALSRPALHALSGFVEIALFPDAYVGLQRIEAGRANLCLLARRSRFERSGGAWESLLDGLLRDSPHLRERLHGAAPLLERPLSIFRVPYGFVHAPSPADPDGVFRLGDQAAVIPSFTGDGMSIALHTASLAARMFLAGESSGAYHRRLRRDVRGQVRLAWAMYRLGATRPGQAAMMAAASWPAATRWAAARTRVPPSALAGASGITF